MTIVSSEILEDIKQAHDQRYVREKHTDHLGEEYIFFYAIGVGIDINAIMASRVPIVETALIDNEIEELIERVRIGEIAVMDISPVHPETDTLTVRKRRFYRKLVRYITKTDSLKLARLIFYPIWYYLKFDSGYTSQQIANYLNVTITQLQKVDNRFQAIHDNLTFIDADDGYIEEIE